MNDKEFCFIHCVNNNDYYKESIRHINDLEIPSGYKINLIPVKNAKSMTSGYNEAMRKSDAKYKIYLHQDVYIINRNFLTDILEIFDKSPKLGLLGVAGGKKLPQSGIWWEAEKRYGQVYDSHTGRMALLKFRDVNGLYEKVQAVDGLIMMTQYDIPWREDIFKGWHFYDVSQSMEFILKGYDVGVPKQDTPWCIHDCGIADISKYEENRKLFIQHYNFYEQK